VIFTINLNLVVSVFWSVLIGGCIFLGVAQGTEVLRTVGEGMAVSSYWYWLRLMLSLLS